MYVVWKKRPLKRGYCWDCAASVWGTSKRQGKIYSLIPLLVESRREKGKVRQIHVARLPAIRSCCLERPDARAEWWRKAEPILKKVPAKARESVRARLAEVILPHSSERRDSQSGRAVGRELLPRTVSEAAVVLGLPWPVTAADLKHAFRALVKAHHPDHGGTGEGFRRVYAAYEVLRERVSG